jgi:hypothetical protein
LNSWKALSVAALCLLQERLPYERSQSVATIIPQLDVGCILRTWRIKGVLVCPSATGVTPCLWVENAYPCGILEVVRQPLKTHLIEVPSLPFDRTTSGHNEQELQFAESRVYTFVPKFPDGLEIPLAVPRGPLFQISYVTELDAPGWRTGLLDLLSGSPRDCAGTWGCYTPRTGFVVQQSEVMASHLQALRAGRVAARPAGRIVLAPHPFEPRTGHYLQTIAPARRSCVSIGNPDIRSIESGAGSKHGAYLFVQFGMFEVCKRCLPVRLLGPRSP